jgi:hypothetical protein
MPNTLPREINEFFDSYRDALNALDGNAVCNELPSISVSPGLQRRPQAGSYCGPL